MISIIFAVSHRIPTITGTSTFHIGYVHHYDLNVEIQFLVRVDQSEHVSHFDL